MMFFRASNQSRGSLDYLLRGNAVVVSHIRVCKFISERARVATLRPSWISWGTILGLSLNFTTWIRDDRWPPSRASMPDKRNDEV